MTVIRWTEAMSVSVPHLDADHQRLIAMIEELRRSGSASAALFDDLLDYVAGHFEREESHLAAIGYPGLAAHHDQHKALEAELGDLLRRHRAGDRQAVDKDLAEFLWCWLKGHILIQDMKYAAWARAIKMDKN